MSAQRGGSTKHMTGELLGAWERQKKQVTEGAMGHRRGAEKKKPDRRAEEESSKNTMAERSGAAARQKFGVRCVPAASRPKRDRKKVSKEIADGRISPRTMMQSNSRKQAVRRCSISRSEEEVHGLRPDGGGKRGSKKASNAKKSYSPSTNRTLAGSIGV